MASQEPRILLREAIDRAKRAAAERGETCTDARIARDVFNVTPGALSEWLSGNNRPKDKHQDIAEEWAGIPADLWATAKERAEDRDARARRALLPCPPPPAPARALRARALRAA